MERKKRIIQARRSNIGLRVRVNALYLHKDECGMITDFPYQTSEGEEVARVRLDNGDKVDFPVSFLEVVR